MLPIAALFTRRNSPYLSLPGVECYDERRDARTYSGPYPVVAHPPCRGWGRYRHRSASSSDEHELAFFALDAVRRFGGVLEHPEASRLWSAAGLLRPGFIDHFGGFTLVIDQCDFGHRARKRTWLYIVRCEPPLFPAPRLGLHSVERMCRAERERTPVDLAHWLVQCARSARPIR